MRVGLDLLTETFMRAAAHCEKCGGKSALVFRDGVFRCRDSMACKNYLESLAMFNRQLLLGNRENRLTDRP
jgi:hypothetical protein